MLNAEMDHHLTQEAAEPDRIAQIIAVAIRKRCRSSLYSKVAFVKLYDRKTPITAADLLNDRVGPSSTKRR